MQAGEQAFGVAALVVDHPVVDEDLTAGVGCGENAAQQLLAPVGVEAVQDVAEHDDVGLRDVVREEVAAAELDAVVQAQAGGVLGEERAGALQVEDPGLEVRVFLDQDGGEVSAGAAEIDEGGMAAPVDRAGDLDAHAVAVGVEAGEEALHLPRVLVLSPDEAALVGVQVLRGTGGERLGEPSPGAVQGLVGQLDEAAEVGGGARDEVCPGQRAVGVLVPGALQQAQAGQRVEEVGGHALVQAGRCDDVVRTGRAFGEGTEHAECHRAVQHLGCAVRDGQLDQRTGVDRRGRRTVIGRCHASLLASHEGPLRSSSRRWPIRVESRSKRSAVRASGAGPGHDEVPPPAASRGRGRHFGPESHTGDDVIRPFRGCCRRRPGPGPRPADRRRGGGSGA